MTDDPDDTREERPPSRSHPELAASPDFGPRYHLVGLLGRGGMGEVYRAFDSDLGGDVALKIVRADHGSDAALTRFRREIALARKITSPHVLRVYDLARHGDLQFVSMELVEGEDLATLLRRESRLPLGRALVIFRQVCVGLAAAHAQGVVHRDLKPQNVLVAHDGRVCVADFGLARSIADSGMTATGAVLGSPAYMSPEQVRGDPADERSDIYSLGIMLYQLVTARTPFRADTPHGVMEMRLHKQPAPMRTLVADVPDYLESIVTRCLALDPAARFRTVYELVAALDAGPAGVPAAPPAASSRGARPKWFVPAVAVGAIVVGGATAVIVSITTHTSEKPPVAPSAATPAPAPLSATPGLLPVVIYGFENQTTDPIFDGSLDVVVFTALRRSERVDPMSVAQVRGLASELGIEGKLDGVGARLAARDHVPVIGVHGAVRAKGAGFEISMSATDDRTGAPVFTQTAAAETFDRVVPVLAELASGLRAAVGEKVDAAEREQSGLSSSLDAVHEFATANAMLSTNNLESALTHGKQAIDHDHDFALAHQLLATVLWDVHRVSEATVEFKAGVRTVDRMGERDRLRFLADYYDTVDEDHDRAISTYEQMLAKWPTDKTAESNLAMAYQARGQIEKALEIGERAAKDHPHDLMVRANGVQYELQAGAYDRAMASFRKIVAEVPRPLPSVFEYAGAAFWLAGQRDDALAAYKRYQELDPSAGAAALADLAIAEGRLADAAAILDAGIAADEAAKATEALDVKRVLLAEVRLRRGDKPGARAAASAVSGEPVRRMEAALVLIAAGDVRPATALASTLSRELAPSRRAFAKLIEGEVLRARGKSGDAMLAFQESLHLVDTPIGHFLLGRAALDAGKATEAYGELLSCVKRSGEASIGVDDVPALRRVPQFTYYLAKAREQLGSDQVAATYTQFLALEHDPDPTDPFVADARKHAP